MARPEKVLIHKILLRHSSRPDVRLWRNETGTFQAPDGSYVSCGLCKGSADLIGIALLKRKMYAVGESPVMGKFVALEVKTAGTATTALQLKFIKLIVEMGGIAGVVENMDDVDSLLGKP